eukprot:TCALIF_11787-PA protein Name:"Protein of unknown function" AED:0.69 eAED:0.69 QI:0/0/0/1/1/0.5/2/0/73
MRQNVKTPEMTSIAHGESTDTNQTQLRSTGQPSSHNNRPMYDANLNKNISSSLTSLNPGHFKQPQSATDSFQP